MPTTPDLPAPPQRARLAVFAALREHDDLARDYALKGGYVFQHVFGSPRPSSDLDLDHVEAHPRETGGSNRTALEDVCRRLGTSLAHTAPHVGLASAELHVVQWSERLPTVFAEVRYTAEGGAGMIELQVTRCERITRTVLARVDGVPVRVAAFDVLVADKLKVLLQQTGRHTVRHADVYDLWFALAEAPFVPDPATVREALLAATASWPELGTITTESFAAPAVRTFAEQGYRALRAEEPALPFAPFDVVWDAITSFVATLGLDAAPPGGG